MLFRSQAKAPKLYFYDWAYLHHSGNETAESGETLGAVLENLVATHLLKHVQYMSDSAGELLDLNYVRTTDGKEIDFVLTNEAGDASHFIEVKLTDERPSYALRQMAQRHPRAKASQIVLQARHAYEKEGVSICPAAAWLNELAA